MERSTLDALESIVGKGNVIEDREQLQDYLIDESVDFMRPKPADNIILVRPGNVKQVSDILQLANRQKIPLFPRGGGTGLAGGAIPTKDGIVLSTERMNRIEIDRENLMAIAEAGVTLETLANSANEAGLFFPLHPGDETAQVGGLAATNAGGARAVRYGVMRSYVKGVEAVLPTGEILNLGGKLHKNNVGYDLMQLIVGSEGTLAVITKAVLRLFPKFGSTATLILPYNSRHDAITSVPKMLREAGIPLAVEYVEKDLMEKTAEHVGDSWPVKAGNCYLIVIVSGSSREHVLSQSLKIGETCQQNGALEPLFVEERDKQDRILKIRSNIYSVLKNDTADILDITVPTAELERVIATISEIAKKDSKYLPVFGHAADGNLHIHFMKNGGGNLDYVESLRSEIYKVTIEAGGTITGEHGIGKIRSPKLQEYVSPREIELMKAIKKIFDPNNILNPGTKLLL